MYTNQIDLKSTCIHLAYILCWHKIFIYLENGIW